MKGQEFRNPESSHNKKTSSPAFWPYNVIRNPEVVRSHNNISVTAAKKSTALLRRATHAVADKISLSYSECYRYREDTVKNIAT